MAMSRYHKALGMFVITLFGLWGCSRGSTSSGSGDKPNLEARLHKVEDELKSAAAARDQNRRKLIEAEEVAVELQQEIDRLRQIVKERDELKGDLKARTLERDQLQVQYDNFRRNIKDLLGQAETTLKNGQPATSEVVAAPGNGGN
jgi:chromosome segregation ATPase